MTADATPTRRRSGLAVALFRAGVQIALVVIFIGGAAFGVKTLIDTKPAAPKRPSTEPMYSVTAMRAETAMNRPRIQVFGSVTERRAVELRALVAGPVVEVNPKLVTGEKVAAGALLVRIDPFAYEGAVVEAKANLTEAQAKLVEAEAQLVAFRRDLVAAKEQVAIAERDLVRARRLAAASNVAERTVDERESALVQRRQAVDTAEAALTTQAARIEQQRAAVDRLTWRLSQAERDLADTTLRTPFDAVVRSEEVDVGKRLSVNDIVARLYDAGALDLSFTLSDRQFGRLRSDDTPLIGRSVDVAWAIGDEPVSTRGVIDRLGPDVSSATGGVALLARLDPPKNGQELRPGAFVTVSMPDRGFPNSVRLPETALYDDSAVFVLTRETADAATTEAPMDDGLNQPSVWRLARRAVTPLAWEGRDIILRGDIDGALVLTSRLAEAGDGVLVQPIEGSRIGVDAAGGDASGTLKAVAAPSGRVSR